MGRMSTPRPSPRFWLAYLAGFGLYLTALAVFLMVWGTDRSFARSLEGAALQVWPGAVAGVAVVLLCQRFPWTGTHRARFLLSRALLAVGFAAATILLQHLQWTTRAWLDSDFVYEFEARFVAWSGFLSLLVASALLALVTTGQIAARWRAVEARVARAEALRAEAELAALRAKLNPHFLFNTLHGVLALVRTDPARAEVALERFGDLLRTCLRVHRESEEEATVEEEWRFTEDYLALERLRLGDRLRVETSIDPAALRRRVPRFTLQPLVENAIRHAVARRPGGGTIRISVDAGESDTRLTVHDDGPGAAPDAVDGAGGVGLRVLRQRLRTLHGEAGALRITTAPGAGFAVGVRVPAASAGSGPDGTEASRRADAPAVAGTDPGPPMAAGGTS